MFSSEIIAPKHLSYVEAERCAQHAHKMVRACSLETLRLLRAKLADMIEHVPADSKSSEVIMIRGAIIQDRIAKFGSKQKWDVFLYGDKKRTAELELCDLDLQKLK